MGAFSNQVALITGAASGIGAEVARQLHNEGAKLVLIDLDETGLKDTAARLGDDRVLSVVADVRELSAVQAAADSGVERFGGIDIVVANAGIVTYGSVAKVDPAAFRMLIDINVVGVFNTVRAALPSITERRGYVLMVSSGAAYVAFPGTAPYAASKAAVEQFANAFRMEIAHLGVDVGSAHMSWIDTPLVRESKQDLSTLRDMLESMRLGRTTSVQQCGTAFIKGIRRRKRRINCPRWVGLVRWLSPLLASRAAERWIIGPIDVTLTCLDAEVAALGRSMSARTAALQESRD
jgi:NAD(P)-dependent dehydrogenase (short-subunit alcohol dehydrogenase family)